MAVDILGNKIDDTLGYVSDIEAARMKAAREARMASSPQTTNAYGGTPIPGQRQGLFNAADYLGQPNVVSSTTQLRDQDNANKLDAQNLLQSILGESATSDGIINNLYGMVGMTGETENERLLREMQRSIGLTTPEDIQQISAFGAQAESAYAPLIQEAEAAKAQGMPKATIAAGERGGFMNTQFAGVGALLPTQGGDFAGTGGILNQIKSEYDANISNLKAQARNARLVAEQAYREYLRTGKMENYNVMKDAVNLEREKLAEALRRASELVNIVGNYQNIQQARIIFEQGQEDKVKTEAKDQLDYYLENYGIDYLKNNQDQISDLLEKAGFESADVGSMITSMENQIKQAEAKNLPKPELRIVGSDLYWISYDANGNPKLQLLAKGKTSSGGGTTTEENKFYSDIASSQENLRQGNTWAQEWNRLFTKYSSGDEAQDNALRSLLDDMLDKNTWSKEGAYQNFKKSTQSNSAMPVYIAEQPK